MSKELEYFQEIIKVDEEALTLANKEKSKKRDVMLHRQWLNKRKASIETALKEYEQYKTIEKELGIDLITLLKVWDAVLQKEYLWTKYDNELDETNDIEIGDEMNGLLYIYFYWSSGKHLVLYLKDYGKTWALTKEELEKWKQLDKEDFE